ncbi:NAD(P)H-quinone oxidoreductase [Alteromonas sp. ASW11-19]|uniref:NAD(P)H-quinone oxidoreductase n=1 Tax=Alteromonas salexigens TaxID=2982530 RepID=A0ABT2VKV9_9ALTE|nr:NAD(P)H-quinone oxidoreductase [Alteromonas salexigens]MCU7553940.1 NAD(P)H-quinone oxidoreductase [Alteromonas salexigens]
MRFIDHERGEGPGGLFISNTARPTLAPGYVRVRVAAFGVNRADTLQRKGMYPPPPGESPILGLEIAGEVIELGDSKCQWQAGDRVFGLVAGGGYAEEVVVLADHLMRCPASLSFEQSAGLAEVFLTAFQCLYLIADIQKEQRALIHAGASGVGLAAIQLCRLFGVETATTASSPEKLALCKEMGASLLINYRQDDFKEVVSQSWPDGVHMVLDVVGGDYLNRNLSLLARDGTVVYLAMLGGRYADKLDMASLLGKRATIQGTTLRNRTDGYKSSLIQLFTERCLAAFDTGELTVHLDTVFAVDDIAQAHQRLENNDSMGKFVGRW